jgi:hypothetical protein
MAFRLSLGWMVTALAAGLAGWLLRGPGPQPTPPTPPAAVAAPAPAAQLLAPPVIAVSSDGQVTLRVEQQPLEWVLEQIAAQGGVVALDAAAPRALAMAPHATPGCTGTREPDVHAGGVLQALQHGSAEHRFQGLLQARNQGVVLPAQTVKALYETDRSDAVRLLALETYLEPRSGDGPATREALEAALRLPNGAVQREARRRLDELAEMERMQALSLQGARH